jgi:hypothetical protein
MDLWLGGSMTDRKQKPRRIDRPEPCYVEMRLTKGGPLLGARIYKAFGTLVAEIGGMTADVERVWTSGDLITKERYDFLMEETPDDPGARIPPRHRPAAF